MSDIPQDAKDVFLAALDIRGAVERAAFLERSCGGDPALRQRVEDLLRAYGQPDGPLDKLAAALAPTELGEPIREQVGATIGPYKLMEQIGEGGFGLVFVAEQQQPIRRKVALKIIKPGMDTRDVIARFEAERQALALMDHPNIAKVLDAGTTESGRPYFVMELVRGIPITDYCDKNQLTPRERLELFVPVCNAIQHAHLKGIIHRDIKPSNVLVTLHDGKPVVKVIDFGVAKALHQSLTDRTIYTRFAQMIGTPLYMSPEQAEMSGLDVDTRTDVYSLGVLLYELLTGMTPFDKKRLAQAAYDELLKIIREEDPPKPSLRLSQSSDSLPSIAALRKTEPTKLSKMFSGDLDWIAMKALEKDRMRRYETANAFAADVLRYLNDEPVEASPPSAGYRLRKFARKYRRGLLLAEAFAGLLVIGAAVSAWEAYRADSAERVARRERDRAVEAEHAARSAKDQALLAESQAVAAKEQIQDALISSLYEQARSVRLAGLPGRRWRALELLKQAERLRAQPRPGPSHGPAATEQSTGDRDVLSESKLRSEAVEALFLRDGHVVREWKGAFQSASPDGRFVAAVSADLEKNQGSLVVTDLNQGHDLVQWESIRTPWWGRSAALGPNAERLATASFSGPTIDLWDLRRRTRLTRLELPPLQTPPSQENAVKTNSTPKNSTQKNSTQKSATSTREAHTGASKRRPRSSQEHIHRLCFSPNGRYLGGIVQGTVPHIRAVVWDLQGDQAGTTLGKADWISQCVFSPDSRFLAFVSNEKKVVLWNLARNQLEKKIEPTLPVGAGGALCFAPDGTLAIGCFEGEPKPGGGKSLLAKIVIWDVAQNREIKRTDTLGSGTIGIIRFSPDGARLAFSELAVDNIRVMDLTGAKPAIAVKQLRSLDLLTWTDDGRHLLTGGRGSLKMWEFTDEPPTSDLRMESKSPLGFEGLFAFSPNGQLVVAKSNGLAGIQLFDRRTGKLVRPLPCDPGAQYSASRLAFSPDGKQILLLAAQHVRLWDAETGAERLRIDATASPMEVFGSAIFRADGSLLVGESNDSRPVVFQPEGDNPKIVGRKTIWRGSQRSLSPALVSPDGRCVTAYFSACAREHPPVPVVDLATGRELFEMSGPPGPKYHATVRELSPDSRWLLALHVFGAEAAGLHAFLSSSGRLGASSREEAPWTADVWDVRSGTRQMQVEGLSSPMAYTFSHDSKYLVVGMANGTCRVWDVSGRRELFDWRPFGDQSGESFTGKSLAFTADEASLAVPTDSTPGFRLLDLPRIKEQLRPSGLDW